MQISGRELGVEGCPISKADNDDSLAASGVPDGSVIWIIASATGPASVIVPKGAMLGG